MTEPVDLLGDPLPHDRRDFLRVAGAAAGATLIGAAQVWPASGHQGKVVRYTSDGLVLPSGEANARAAKEALDECLMALLREKRSGRAWRRLFKPTDVVGLKVNCLAGKPLASDPNLVEAVVEGIQSTGVRPQNIIVFDRTDADLAKAGFDYNRGGKGVQCYGTESDYDANLTTKGQVSHNLSKILSTTCTAIVNMPILKDHSIVGVSGAMKNHWGCINNPSKYHRKCGDPFVADTYSIRQVHGKERLIIGEALRACFDLGPAPDASRLEECMFYPKAIMVSTDAVATDYLFYRMISDERAKRKLPSLKEAKRQPNYIVTAAKYGLGVRDPRQTQVTDLPSA